MNKRVFTQLAIVAGLSLWGLHAQAQKRMTSFKPEVHGFNFSNRFANDFLPKIDVRTGGLCGGMSYTAADFYFAKKRRPDQPWRPANRTKLQSYIYNRQVTSLTSNLDKWAEVGFNPGGARNDEFFRWGLETKRGSRIAELRSYIDRGTPVPLGIPGAKGSGNHQVLAIGYDLAGYRGARVGSRFRVFVYDPNFPRRTMQLRPNFRDKVWELHYDDGKSAKKYYQTYFVDRKYRPKTPGRLDAPANYRRGDAVRDLIIRFNTGRDDLRGGRDNVNAEVKTTDGRRYRFSRINLGARWLRNYEQFVRVTLPRAVPRDRLQSITFTTTFRGGVGGDNWDLNRLEVFTPYMDGRQPKLSSLRTHNRYTRFTGSNRPLTVSLATRSTRTPAASSRISLRLLTGNDDLRGGRDNLNVIVAYKSGPSQSFANVNKGRKWGRNSERTVTLNLRRGKSTRDIERITLQTTSRGGMGGDNWDLLRVVIPEVNVTRTKNNRDRPIHRFTGSKRTYPINL